MILCVSPRAQGSQGGAKPRQLEETDDHGRNLDWCAEAVASEVAYSIARGGSASDHGRFIHLLNLSVPWSGDYNRAVGIRASNAVEFEQAVQSVARIHEEHERDSPDHFDMWPAQDDPIPFEADLPEGRYRIVRDLFMVRDVTRASFPEGFVWRRLGSDEFVAWWLQQQRLTDYYDPDMCSLDAPLEERFARTFVPFFLERDGAAVAWVHCAEFGDCMKLFSVEVDERERGKGLGRALLQAVEAEAAARSIPHVLIRCVSRIAPFYRACGYEERCRGAMVRTVGSR